MMVYGHGMGMAGWLWMTAALVLLTALLVVAIVAGLRLLDRTAGEPAEVTPADRVLAERFARGEITEEQYQHRMAVLRAARH